MLKQYPPVNRCIYCGSQEDLSKEHILPYALGGRLVLPRASCSRHRDLTSEIERKVARGMYGDYRDSEGIQTRHRKRQELRGSATVTLPATTFADVPCQVSVPIGDLPRHHISVHLPVPQLLSGRALTPGGVGARVTSQLDPVRLRPS